MNNGTPRIITRNDMVQLVCEALESLGGEGTIVDTAAVIWKNYKDDLESSGDIFYTWQYDMRWARHKLSKTGKLTTEKRGKESIWKLI